MKHTDSEAFESRGGAGDVYTTNLSTQQGKQLSGDQLPYSRDKGEQAPGGRDPSLVSYPINHTCHSGEKKTKGKRMEASRKRLECWDGEKKIPPMPLISFSN